MYARFQQSFVTSEAICKHQNALCYAILKSAVAYRLVGFGSCRDKTAHIQYYINDCNARFEIAL